MDKLHLLIWKQLIALLVRIEGEGEKFSAHKVWAPAWIRFEKKVLAHKEKRKGGHGSPQVSEQGGEDKGYAKEVEAYRAFR